MYNIRKARMADLNQLVFMSRKFWEGSPYTEFSFGSDKIAAFFRTNMDDDTCFIWVATHNNKPIGMLVAKAVQLIFSHDYSAAEVAWFIEEEHRQKAAVSLRLLAAYNNWIKEKGFKAGTLAMLSTSPTQVKEVYNRLGYKPVEISYQKVFN